MFKSKLPQSPVSRLLSRVLVSSVLLFFVAPALAGDLVLAQRGLTPDCAIVVGPEAGPSVVYAAEELRDWTARLTDVTLPLATNGAAGACSARQTIRLREIPATGIEEDAFRLRSDAAGLIIEGGKRGVLYGVYEILERFGGIAFLSPAYTDIPKRDMLAVPADLDFADRPAFEMREPYWWNVKQPDFAARLRVNGAYSRLKPRHGGVSFPIGSDMAHHTLARLLPVAAYGAAHPEYYALQKGKRVIDPSDVQHKMQPCLSHPDVFGIVRANLVAYMRAHPADRRYAVSFHDNTIVCECPACAAVVKEEGSAAGLLVRFINRLAESFAAEFPDKYLYFSAYLQTRRPPKTKPHKNVIVGLCPIEVDQLHPIETSVYPQTASFRADFEGWSKLTDNLAIWDYHADFNEYTTPLASVAPHFANLRYFRDHGVRLVMTEGAYQGRGSDFGALKTYLDCKAFWNPDADIRALTDRFFAGYYGAAASFVREYYEALQRCVPKDGTAWLGYFGDVQRRTTCPDALLAHAHELFVQAAEAVKDDPTRLQNVRETAFSPEVTRFFRAVGDFTPDDFLRRTSPVAAYADFHAEAVWLQGVIDELGDVWFTDGRRKNQQKYFDRILSVATNDLTHLAFEPCDRRVLAADAAAFKRIEKNGWCALVSAGETDGTNAVRLSNADYQWCLQLKLPLLAFDPGVRYRLRVRAKVTPQPDADPQAAAFVAGYSSPYGEKVPGALTVKAGTADGTWQWYELKPFTATRGLFAYFANGVFDKKAHKESPAVKDVLIDRVEIVREEGEGGW